MTRFVAWNINARTDRLDLHELGIESALLSLKPEPKGGAPANFVVVLSEYLTKRDEHERFTQALKRAGMDSVTTPEEAGQNRLLIAANIDIEPGQSSDDSTVLAAKANYLHVFLPSLDLDLVGLRVPWYTSMEAFHKRSYPAWLIRQLQPLTEKRCLVIGDFNFDPSKPKRAKWIQSYIREQLLASSDRADLAAKWYFCSPDGNAPSFKGISSLDHALRTSAVPEPTCIRYVSEVAGLPIMTNRRPSDHATLVLDIDFVSGGEHRTLATNLVK